MPAVVSRVRLLGLPLLAVAVVCGLKLLLRGLGWEPLAPNPLVTALVAATVFLLGFLLSGVLADYKESERLPGEMGTALLCLAQELHHSGLASADADPRPALAAVALLGREVLGWLDGQHDDAPLQLSLRRAYGELALVARWNPAPLQARLLLELANLQRGLVRVATIRDTDFLGSVYALANLAALLLGLGLLLSRDRNLGEALFFLAVLTALLSMLLLLIADLDNPFAHHDGSSVENVSLLPLQQAVRQLEQLAAEPARLLP